MAMPTWLSNHWSNDCKGDVVHRSVVAGFQALANCLRLPHRLVNTVLDSVGLTRNARVCVCNQRYYHHTQSWVESSKEDYWEPITYTASIVLGTWWMCADILLQLSLELSELHM